MQLVVLLHYFKGRVVTNDTNTSEGCTVRKAPMELRFYIVRNV